MNHPFSCDTSVVLGSLTADGSVIFAKNSDRPPNECQPLYHSPRRQYPAGATVKCQYIEIPQVAETWEVIGSRPYWLWGFEIGVNEWGVTIGNEAVYTREPYGERALIGMDLLRLGLERAKDANEAVLVIGKLLEQYGQGGSCYAKFDGTYHNSFIIADSTKAWVLETAGRHWVARRVEDRASISNVLTIDQWDTGSDGVAKYARQQGWADGAVSFARAYQDPNSEPMPAVCRLERAQQILRDCPIPVTVADMMTLLRDHNEQSLPTTTDSLPTLCLHANPVLIGETAGSMVVQLRPGRPQLLTTTCWTAFGSPCLSIFRPVYPHAVGLPENLDVGTDMFTEDSPWWVFERLQRMVVRAPSLAAQVRASFAALEQTFIQEAADAEESAERYLARGNRNEAVTVLRALVDSTSERAIASANAITHEIEGQMGVEITPEMNQFWNDLDRDAGVDPSVKDTVSATYL